MDAVKTLSILNTVTEWFDHGGFLRLRCNGNAWYMVDDGQDARRLHLYSSLEPDIENAFLGLYPHKPAPHLPLAACDDGRIRDPGVLLLKAESRFRIHVYWFDEEDDEEGVLDDWGVYVQPISKLMSSMRMRVRWTIAIIKWCKESKEMSYMPNGTGFKRAREDFEEVRALM